MLLQLLRGPLRVVLWLCAFCMASSVWARLPDAEPQAKRVLIVQSQAAGDLFHSAVAAKITESLPKQTPRTQVFVEALDAGRLSSWQGPEFLANLQHKYRATPFDIIVTIGSPAVHAMLVHGAGWMGLRPWVVVNAGPRDLAAVQTLPNVVVMDNVGADFTRNMELIKELRPDLDTLLVIGRTSTPQMQDSVNDAISQVRPLFKNIERLNEGRDTVLVERLRQASARTGVYLVGWLEDATGQRLDDKELRGAISARVGQPVFSSWDFVLGEGVVGGKMAAVGDMGSRAGEVVSGLLEGKSVRDFERLQAFPAHYIFDFRALKTHGIAEDRLPPGSEVRYKPLSLAQTSPQYFFGGIAAIAILACSLVALALVMQARRKVTQKNAMNEQHFRMLFDDNPTALLVFDTETMQFLSSNQRAKSLLGGMEVSSETSLPTLAFIPPEDRADFEASLRKMRHQPFNHIPALNLVKRNGERLRCEVFSHAIDYFGRSARLVMINDITQRIHAENKLAEQFELLNTLVDTIPHPVFWKDTRGHYLGANHAFTKVLGRPVQDIVGRTFRELTLDPHPERFINSDFQLLEHPGTVSLDERMVFGDGLEHDVLMSKSTFHHRNGEVAGIVGAITDISHVKRSEEQLRELNAELEQRVRARTAELSRANDELCHAMQQLVQREKLAALGNLVAGVAHELNTPLGNTLTVATSLAHHVAQMRDAFGQGDLWRSALGRFLDDAGSACALLERNTQRAAELVASFKQVAVDQTSVRRRQFELHKLVADTLVAVTPAYRKLLVTVSDQIPPGLHCDSYPGPLEQVLVNLIDNAVLHALGEDGTLHIDITAEVAADQASMVLRVTDDGVGMDEDTVRRAFDPFFTTRLGRGGSGLGLYIVHNLVASVLGGTVRLQSTPGQGTCFELHLPWVAPHYEATHA